MRDDLIEHQEIYLDPCNLTDDEAEHVVVAIREEVARFRADGDGLQLSWSDIKHAREAQILAWRGNWDDS